MYCCSVAQLYPTLWDPMDCSTAGFLVFHYLTEFAKLLSIESMTLFNHFILWRPLFLQPSIFPSSKIFSNELSLCIRRPKYIGASASASVFLVNIQDWFPLGLTGLISLLSKGLSSFLKTLKSSCTTVQKHQFFGPQTSLWSNSHIRTWLLEKPYLGLYGLWSAK